MDEIIQIIERSGGGAANFFAGNPGATTQETATNVKPSAGATHTAEPASEQNQTADSDASKGKDAKEGNNGNDGLYTPQPTEMGAISTSTSSTTTEPQTKGPMPVTTVASSTSTTSEPTTTETSTDSPDTGLSSTTKLAIALPIAIVGLIVIAGLIFFFLRRRRRNAAPKYDMATGGQTSAISSSELMAIQKGEASVPANSSIHNLPPIQVSQQQTHAPDPVSTTARSGMNDSQTELGLATAVPLDQRQSASRQDLPRFSGSASRTSTPRMPFETRTRGEDDDDDDDVSIVSGMNERRHDRVERDFDDMSSVSSFEDDENQQRANLNDPSHRDISGDGHSR